MSYIPFLFHNVYLSFHNIILIFYNVFVSYHNVFLSILKSKKASQSRKAKQSDKKKDEEEDDPVASIVVKTTQASVEVSIAHFHIAPDHYSKSARLRSTIQLMHY